MKDTSGKPTDRQWLQEMCELVKNKLPENYSFVVFGFPSSGTDRMYYASNATRESAVAALKEWMQQTGADGWLKHVPPQKLTRCEIEDAVKAIATDEPFTMPFFLACLLRDECRRQGLNDFKLDDPDYSVVCQRKK